jgi:hypothetical protein
MEGLKKAKMTPERAKKIYDDWQKKKRVLSKEEMEKE